MLYTHADAQPTSRLLSAISTARMRKQLLRGGQIGLSAISYLGLAATTNTGCCLPCNNFWYKICERTDRDREDVEDAMTQPRIAVIDDDAAFLEMIDTMLTDAGYQTLLSSDGRTAYTLDSSTPAKSRDS
jgi:hypothetical protein